ncbi:hypothetical protein BI364_01610 [Acidihalobacter yilgarnensis]|uniref:Outer membrane protein beta-barrel domain-containing protein n=2 Tax=Acidihalobacter yilgarnensis TaxID=2819280 RepID=A0A1D8IK86_9GAMM|nr:hypothetical protein BI364_01610 [Acidihalobacter yilgarnensis]
MLLASGGTAWAGEVNTTIVNADRYLSVQVGGLQQNYRETNNGTVPDKEQGFIPRIGVEYSLLGLERPFRFVLGASYASGNTYYKGGLQNGTPYDTNTGNHILDAHVGLGYAFGFGSFALTPGIEYGEHSWERNINHGTSSGYQERYGNQYMAATLEGQFALSQSTVLSLSGAYGTTLNPTMTNNLYPGLTYYLGTKPWARVGLKLDYAAYSNLHMGVQLSYTRFAYGVSSLYPVGNNLGTYEPNSETRQTAFDLSLSYNF